MVPWRIRSSESFGPPREGRDSRDLRSTKFLVHDKRQWEVNRECQTKER